MNIKKYLCVLLLLAAINLNGQNKFEVTLNFDTSINMQKASFRYYNGIAEIPVRVDSLSNVINIKDDYYSEKAVLNIQYIPKEETWYSESFFIENKPATIHLQFNDQKDEPKFYVKNITNAVALYDTAQNKIYNEFIKFIEKESINMQKLWQHYGKNFGTNDSATAILKNVTRQWNDKAILFFRSHNQEYFSFWWFKNQIVDQAEYCFANDTSYFRKLINDFSEVFPEKYTHSIEGEKLLQTINRIITPPPQIKIGETVPYFIGKNTNVLPDFKSAYLLIHFWATWCIPCKQQIPILQNLKNNTLSDKLTIVSICTFSDSTLMSKDVSSYKMSWKNVYDKYNEITDLLGISSVPYLILINQNGIIEYIDSENSKENEKRISDIVNGKGKSD